MREEASTCSFRQCDVVKQLSKQPTILLRHSFTQAVSGTWHVFPALGSSHVTVLGGQATKQFADVSSVQPFVLTQLLKVDVLQVSDEASLLAVVTAFGASANWEMSGATSV